VGAKVLYIIKKKSENIVYSLGKIYDATVKEKNRTTPKKGRKLAVGRRGRNLDGSDLPPS